MITNPEIIQMALNYALKNAYKAGAIKPDENRDLAFRFSASQIIGLHFHLKGVGYGLFFRLNDKSVWNAYDEMVLDESDFMKKLNF